METWVRKEKALQDKLFKIMIILLLPNVMPHRDSMKKRPNGSLGISSAHKGSTPPHTLCRVSSGVWATGLQATQL